MKTSKTITKIILIIGIIATVLLIFKFSSQQSAQSDSISRGFTARLVKIYWNLTGQGQNEDLWETAKKLNGIVRKYAHFTLYSVLGAVSMSIFGLIIFRRWDFKIWIYALLFCLLYAASDEFHQLFVPGRSAEIRDVFIDFMGSMWSSMLVFGIGKYIKDRK